MASLLPTPNNPCDMGKTKLKHHSVSPSPNSLLITTKSELASANNYCAPIQWYVVLHWVTEASHPELCFPCEVAHISPMRSNLDPKFNSLSFFLIPMQCLIFVNYSKRFILSLDLNE